MGYELKRATSKYAKSLAAPFIKEAEGGVIRRSNVKNGGTFVVPADESAQVGDEVFLMYTGHGRWFTWITLTAEQIGKPLQAKVDYIAFSEGDQGEAFYEVKRVDGSVEHAPVSKYEVKD